MRASADALRLSAFKDKKDLKQMVADFLAVERAIKSP
jgi:hypothetical protein